MKLQIRTKFLLGQLEKKFYSRVCTGETVPIKTLDNKKVLIIAPHPDDEVIGCGGIIQNINHTGNAEVYVLFVTVEDERSVVKPSYIDGTNIRHLESRDAKAVLKYRNAIYLNIKERSIEKDKMAENNLQNKISELLINLNINIAFLPNHFDMNPDHRIICEKSLRQIGLDLQGEAKLSLESIYLYEIWGPVKASHFVILTSEQHEKKLLAMECYKTQLVSADYKTIIAKISHLRRQQLQQNRSDVQEEPKTYSTEYFEYLNPLDIPDYLKCHF